MKRFNLLPDERFEGLKGALKERMHTAAGALDVHSFGDLIDGPMRAVLKTAFDAAGADEGSIWLVNARDRALEPAYNTGPNAAEFVGSFQQPLGADNARDAKELGIISSVFSRQITSSENKVYLNKKHDPRLDNKLKVVTCSQIAVPFKFVEDVRGVISCVKLKPSMDAPDPPGFDPAAHVHVERAAKVIGKLIDHRLLGVTVGWLPE